ncbi:MAG: hypothetical protein HYU41_03090 [Candidatus Rokubacteria bacterium]|nr:hypothetical protein [Candidatus Rokubacteria bacterium]
MKTRIGTLAVTVGAVLVAIAAFAAPADAQVNVCSGNNFATASGTSACDGSSSAITASATVQNSAKLILQEVFGSAASGLTVAFGNVDALCANTPGTNITCTAAGDNLSATWFGDIKFTARLGGLGSTTKAKLVGVRPAAGSIPTAQLLDGASGSAPATAYPVGSGSTDLKTTIGNGNTDVTRAIGVKVTTSDAAGSWSGTVAYSLVIE